MPDKRPSKTSVPSLNSPSTAETAEQPDMSALPSQTGSSPRIPPPPMMLAPMQDVTDLAFLRTLHGLTPAADIYVTPYFRVVSHSSHLDEDLADMIRSNPTERPILAQIIGSDADAMCRLSRELRTLPIAGIDLNIGCPAPIVCRKDAGGGALKNTTRLDYTLGRLRDAIPGQFTVKTRIGYETPREFDDLLAVFRKHAIDRLVVHGRTVREGYQAPVHPGRIKQAVENLSCPVFANGNAVDVATGLALLNRTGAHGIMIGRGAVRNPWIFEQIRQKLSGNIPHIPAKRELLAYITRLFDETARLMLPYRESSHIHRMKKFLVYIVQGHPAEFEYRIRRVTTATEFHSICREYLDTSEPIPDTPPTGTKLFACFEDLTKNTNQE